MNPMKTVTQVRITSPLFSGLAYSLSMMTIGTIVTSLFLLLTSTQESSLHTLTTIIHAAALFIGGWVSGKEPATAAGTTGDSLDSSILSLFSWLAF